MTGAAVQHESVTGAVTGAVAKGRKEPFTDQNRIGQRQCRSEGKRSLSIFGLTCVGKPARKASTWT